MTDNIANMDVVEAVLNSNLSAYAIEKSTGISRMTITNYRKGKAKPMKMTVENAILLTEYGEKYLEENVMDAQFIYDFIDMIWEEMTEENVAVNQMEAYLEEDGDSGIRQQGTVYVDEDNVILTIPMSDFEESYCMYRNEDRDLIRDDSMNKDFKMDMLSDVKRTLKEKDIKVK